MAFVQRRKPVQIEIQTDWRLLQIEFSELSDTLARGGKLWYYQYSYNRALQVVDGFSDRSVYIHVMAASFRPNATAYGLSPAQGYYMGT